MPPDAKDNQDGKIASLDAAKAYENLALSEKEQAAKAVADRQAELAKETASKKSAATATSAEARADLLAGVGAPTEKAPTVAPDRSAEKEELRYQNSLSKLGDSSICPDLVTIIKKKGGDKVDQTAGWTSSQFAKVAGQVMDNLSTLDSDIAQKADQEKSGKFKPFRAIMEKWITQETAAATADKIGRLRQVAETFRNMMDIIEKNEPVQNTAKPVESPTGQASAAPSSNAPAAPAEKKPEGVLGKIWDYIKELFDKLGKWWSGFSLFGKPAAAPTTPSPAPAPGVSPNVPSAPPSPANPESLKGPDSTAGLKGNALLENEQFKARTDQIAAKIGVSRSDLYAIFKMESGADPAIQNKDTKATGLIQWVPKTAPLFGTTVEQLKTMTGLQQLDYVEKYYQPHFGKLRSFSDLYRAVFFPASIGKGPDWIFGSERPNDPDWRVKVAEQNSGIAAYGTVPAMRNGVQVTIKKGGKDVPLCLIDNAAFEKHCAKQRPADSSVPLAVS